MSTTRSWRQPARFREVAGRRGYRRLREVGVTHLAYAYTVRGATETVGPCGHVTEGREAADSASHSFKWSNRGVSGG